MGVFRLNMHINAQESVGSMLKRVQDQWDASIEAIKYKISEKKSKGNIVIKEG